LDVAFSRRGSGYRNAHSSFLGVQMKTKPKPYNPPSVENQAEYVKQYGARQYRFQYHYNVAASKKAGRPLFTVHYRTKRWITESVVCSVASETHIMSALGSPNPRHVVRGHCYNMSIDAEGWGTIASPFKWIWLHNDLSRWTK